MKIIINTEKILKKVKVGGRMIEVLYPYQFKERDDLCGQAHYSRGIILLAGKDSSGNEYPKEAVFENFIHEVMHCICHTYNGEVQIEERETCALSHGWYQVLVDNFGEVDERNTP